MIGSISAVAQVVTDDYALYQGDSCELLCGLPAESIDLGVHSPPFEGLYKFSAFDRDVSNNDGEDFWTHYGFIIRELLRVTKPGRLCAVHCMQLPTSKTRDGFIGMRDFRGEIVRAYQAAGWIFHSEFCIRKDPVVAQERTKSIRLLHKQIVKNRYLSGQGLADYIVVFRKPGESADAIAGLLNRFVGVDLDLSAEAYQRHLADCAEKGWDARPFDVWRSILIWQRYAEPVWCDIDQTRTLQYRAAREAPDELHIAPLQLDVIERCVQLWSNPGEVVLTPFLGIGSEVYGAVAQGRRGIGIELKPSYFAQAVRNLAARESGQAVIFGEAEPVG